MSSTVRTTLILLTLVVLSLSFFFVPSPPWVDGYLLPERPPERTHIARLLSLIPESSPETRLIAVKEIAGFLAQEGLWTKRAAFLSGLASRTPDSPLTAYYLYLLARQYQREGAEPLALLYYRRILEGYPDLLIEGIPLHFLCLRELADKEKDPYTRIRYYNLLIQRYASRIDAGVAYYFLAKSYEQAGMWDDAIRTYRLFLNYPATSIPGEPEAYLKVQELLAFHDSPKNWLFDDLESLFDAVTYAIRTRNAALLSRYRAKVNFFSISWEQERTAKNAQVIFDFTPFFSGTRVRYASELDPSSTPSEAYLRTWGWSYRINVWYLYFRRVNYPFDPDIDGKWEWAGIYFGEKF